MIFQFANCIWCWSALSVVNGDVLRDLSGVSSTINDSEVSKNLVRLFNRCFRDSYQTILVSGGDEPIYLPAGEVVPGNALVGETEPANEIKNGTADSSFHRIVFYRDYPRSALHEVSHWCIAGTKRRMQTDYGYWYQPDGRTAEQQTIFEQVEIRPQAIEWILCRSVGLPFRVSSDNLNGDQSKTEQKFKENIVAQVYRYFETGLPERADIYCQSILSFFQPSTTLDKALFDIEELG
ncbi:MAG: hypothetical protein CSA52_00050 [Gammaproteobacteria bacterium]|nr:MAG: hypothetical protein CSB48_11985 [Pseudomonadota bacterium]PIE39081.1 MAG: hypothetical protein CSA52_00050 [Gammaproteobacteria bacterium]